MPRFDRILSCFALLALVGAGCALSEPELTGLSCPCATGYRCIVQTCQPDPLVRDPMLVRWTGIDPGLDQRPTITIDDSIYPDEKGVRFLIDGAVDLRAPSARPNGYDDTGPQDASTFHIYPNLELMVGQELEAHWSDQSGNWRASVFVVGAEST